MKQITIGRSQENDVVINDPSVSRQHATIIHTGNDIVVYDNGSSNGTFINGNRIHGEGRLKNTDILKLGSALVPWRNYFQEVSSQEEVKTRIVKEEPQKVYSNYENTAQSNTNRQHEQQQPNPKKSKIGQIIGIGVIAFIIVVFVVLNLIKRSSVDDYNSGFPNPTIIDQRIEYAERGLFDKTLMGYVEVRNDSNFGGNVEIIATCSQEGQRWDQSEIIFLNPGQTEIIEFEFTEIKRLKYEPEFSATANIVEY
jgi:pSer/pThr/pTyr-binding forkhead associated (FHA) protein